MSLFSFQTVSSFDLIRKEKQQQKAAQAKAQKQQQNNDNTGRVRAKSQSDKLLNNGNNQQSAGIAIKQQTKQRLQKQQSLIVTNSNAAHLTPPPMSGTELLALAAAAATSPKNNVNGAAVASVNLLQALNLGTVGTNGVKQKQRPSSVALHFPSSPVSAHTVEELELGLTKTHQQNLRILKRSTSHQPASSGAVAQQKLQQQQRQAQLRLQQHPQQMKFNPSFNSWTNFSFTKNFITNVFC